MRADIVVHPDFHTTKNEEASVGVDLLERALIEKMREQGSTVLLLCEPSSAGGIFYEATPPEYRFVSDHGQCRLVNTSDVQRIAELLDGATSFLVHGCYMELCVYDLATRLHDALIRGHYDGLLEPSSDIWSPLGRFDDVDVRLGHVLRSGPTTEPLNPCVFPFLGPDTFIYSAS